MGFLVSRVKAAGNGDPFDLTPYNVPWTPAWPTSPTITNGEQTVTTANYTTYLDDSGKRLIFTSGTYGVDEGAGNILTKFIDVSDMEIVLQDGADLNTLYFENCQRMSVRCENPRQAGGTRIWVQSGNDILINGIAATITGAFSNPIVGGTRIAIVGCLLTTGQYGFYSDGPTTDVILANNDVRTGTHAASPQSMARLTACSRLIVVRNRFSRSNGGLAIRVYTEGSAYLDDNQIEVVSPASSSGNVLGRSGVSEGPDSPFYGIIFNNNRVYKNDGEGPMVWDTVASNPVADKITAQGNAFFGTGGWPADAGDGDWVIGGSGALANTAAAYTSPPAWDFA